MKVKEIKMNSEIIYYIFSYSTIMFIVFCITNILLKCEPSKFKKIIIIIFAIIPIIILSNNYYTNEAYKMKCEKDIEISKQEKDYALKREKDYYEYNLRLNNKF